jgi:putative transcriptional regulator
LVVSACQPLVVNKSINLQNNLTVGRIAVIMEKDELKKFREDLELSQAELAKQLKVATNTVSRWEIGTRKIPEFLDLALQTIQREIKKKG